MGSGLEAPELRRMVFRARHVHMGVRLSAKPLLQADLGLHGQLPHKGEVWLLQQFRVAQSVSLFLSILRMRAKFARFTTGRVKGLWGVSHET